MSISRYNPFRDSVSLRRAMDQLFEESFVHPRWLGDAEAGSAPMDVYEDDQGYHMHVSLPGVKPEDIELTVHQNTVTIKGHYSSTTQEPRQQGQGTQTQQGNWLLRERHSGSFQRSITFDRSIDTDKIETSYEHGVLTITLPISQASQPRRIQVGSGRDQSQQINIDTQPEQG